MSDLIKHDAIIKEVGTDTVKVSIVSKAACLSCQMKSYCSVAEMQEKIIEVKKPRTGLDKYDIGEQVNVVMYESLGIKALMLGYIVPFFVLLVTLVVAYGVTHNEPLSGLLALASLAPYYFVLYLFKEKLSKQFNFEIEK